MQNPSGQADVEGAVARADDAAAGRLPADRCPGWGSMPWYARDPQPQVPAAEPLGPRDVEDAGEREVDQFGQGRGDVFDRGWGSGTRR